MKALKTLANEKDCVFIDHTDSFLTRGGEIIEDFLLMDGLHLSAAGIRKLLKKLKYIIICHGKAGYATDHAGMAALVVTWPGRFQRPTTAGQRQPGVTRPPGAGQAYTPPKKVLGHLWLPL